MLTRKMIVGMIVVLVVGLGGAALGVDIDEANYNLSFELDADGNEFACGGSSTIDAGFDRAFSVYAAGVDGDEVVSLCV